MPGGLFLVVCAVLLSSGGAVERHDRDNAALQYWLAFALCPEEDRTISMITTYDSQLGFGVPVSSAVARYFAGRGHRALLHLHRGAAMLDCEWGTDLRKDGLLVAAPYGVKAHSLGRLALLRARWRFEHDDWEGGIGDVIATMRLGRHIARDRVGYNYRYSCMLETMTTSTAAYYLPVMPRAARAQLANRLNELPTRTSMREVVLYYQDAIDWAVEAFRVAEKEDRLHDFIVSVWGQDDAKAILAIPGGAQTLIRLAEAGRDLARDVAQALALRPDRYNQRFRDSFRPRLNANPVAAMLAPDYETARDEEAAAQCRLLLLKTGIDVLDRGEDSLKEHPDPYGDGGFVYQKFQGGFSLTSALVYGRLSIGMQFGSKDANRVPAGAASSGKCR